jgi:hypothetical protein
MSSGSDYVLSMPKVLRPRTEFPTPLFKLTAALLAIACAALSAWLIAG